ncbi:MAG: tellurium resistance protein TerC [Anaerolineae bacterium]|nr:tellurium resistance protein TerC [Anaerolineae bacterium]MDW8099508.1 tellurium resistance protein TerC [Anaerolineae bacterium]
MTTILVVVQLVFLEGVLSLDNAAVLGAMAASLPDNLPVPWPRWWSAFGHALDQLLGPQQTAALRVGLFGAYLGRGLMLILATWVIRHPWLKLLGALYLLKLAAANLSRPDGPAEPSLTTAGVSRFWQTVLAIELTDLTFSLDNVVAVVALSDRLLVVVMGVALGILMMRFAAGVFAYLVQREPILERTAYVLVLNISIELLLEEFTYVHLSDLAKFVVSASTLGLAIAYAHLRPLRVFAPALQMASRCLGIVNEGMEWIIASVKTLYSASFGPAEVTDAADRNPPGLTDLTRGE